MCREAIVDLVSLTAALVLLAMSFIPKDKN